MSSSSSSTAPTTARVWSLVKPGAVSNLQLKEITLPAVPAGHIRVKVHAIGLNFADIFATLGLYFFAPKEEFVPGLEYAGEIEALGEGVSNFKVGDRVAVITKINAYSSHTNADARHAMKIPDGWTYEQGCAFPVQTLTAYYGLVELGNIKRGKVALVQSAAGGVGIQALQILQKKGAIIIGTVSSKDKADFLVSKFNLQPHQIIVRTSGHHFEAQLTETLEKLGKKGIDVCFDSLCGDYFQPTYNKLNNGGRLVVLGSGSLMPSGNLGFNVFQWLRLYNKFSKRPFFDPLKLMEDNKSIMGCTLNAIYTDDEMFQELYEGVQSLNLDPPTIDKTFDFEHLVEGLQHFQTGRNVGKVVVTIK